MQPRTRTARSTRASATERSIRLAGIALLASTALGHDVRSRDGRFTARVESAKPPSTKISVVDASTAKEVLVWSAPRLEIAPADQWRLTDDGQSLVAIDSRGVADQPLVQVVRAGKILCTADAVALGVPPELLGSWLSADPTAVRLRVVDRPGDRSGASGWWLDLLGRDAQLRSVDLVTGALKPAAAPPVPGRVQLEPAASADAEPMFVSQWFAPDVAIAGEPLPVHVKGSLPTPAWTLAGFSLEGSPNWKDGAPPVWTIVPRAAAPPPDSVSIMVLKGFDETARVFGLEPGLHRIDVRGRDGSPPDPRPVRVLQPGTAFFLEKRGGIAGVRETLELFDDGRVVVTSAGEIKRVFLADPDVHAAIARELAKLPVPPPRRAPSGGADMFAYEIVWRSSGGFVRTERDDANLEPQTRELAGAAERLATPISTSVPYSVDLARSFLEVRTGSGGLLSAFGHDHHLMVRRFTGRAEIDRSDLSKSTIEITVEAGSLAVVDNDSQDDRREIELEMNRNVLEVLRHPTITFRGLAVEVGAARNGKADLVLEGELALHGVTKKLRLAAKLELRDDSVRAIGAIPLLQSDFGIRPTSAVAGTVKVADEVKISFDVTAIRD